MDETHPPTAPDTPSSVGARLAEARRAQKLTLDEVAARTRVPVRHLEAIEQGEHANLPAATYSVGFVRTYAQTLGLDAAALAYDFRAEIGQRPSTRYAPEPFEPADPARVPSRLLALIALAIALLLAAGYAVWRSGVMSGDSPTERAQLATGVGQSQEAAPSAPAAPSPSPARADGPVTLTATDAVWLRVYEKGGARLLEKQMNAGESWQVPATAHDPEILTGRPQALRITVGTTVIPPLGPPEKTVADVSLAPQALLARRVPPAAAALAPASAPARTAATPETPPAAAAPPIDAAPPSAGNAATPPEN